MPWSPIIKAKPCSMPSDSPSDTEPWTILKTLHWTVDFFKRHHLDTARIDAELLLAKALKCQRIDLYIRHDQPLDGNELSIFKGLIRRRAAHEPIAYITGIKEFWSLPFEVTPDVLIPRPDTECLVERAVSVLTDRGFGDSARTLELGVGSGAITVALAHEYRNGRFFALDRSWAAICLAKKNAGRNLGDHRIHFFAGDWMDALSADRALFDMIISNPPYIPTADIATLSEDIRRFEPVAALDGGPDGLDAIRRILETAHLHLRPGGALLLEMGSDQRAAIEKYIDRLGHYSSVAFYKDYGGHDRVVLARK